jgi:sodium-dependent dicarboxylate transporter 2/3/5
MAGPGISWWNPATAGFVLGPLLFLLIQLLPVFPEARVANMASIAALMVVWWITETLPLAATALLPLLLFPLLGISSGADVAETYMNSTIFLFIGGFVLALSMQRWDLHTRIALRVIGWFHGSARLMLLGFMITSALLSMWISNTATATMLLPIALAVYARASDQLDEADRQALLTALMLGIAYSCSIGGTATLIGTPPNMAMQRIFAITFPSAPEISFAQWLVFALPMAVCLLLLCWGVISARYTGRRFTPLRFSLDGEHALARKPMTYEERAVAVVFVLAAIGWMFRQNIVIGDLVLPGWSGLFENANLLNDGSVAIAAALALFCLPARNRVNYKRLADEQTIAAMPWNIVLLFGGGFALAKGFADSGLSAFIGNGFIGMQQLEPVAMVAGITTTVVFLTEVTSNTATAQMMLPLVAGIARSIGVNPLLLMLPVTLAASMAFMMPVATPPNAIVFASGRLRIRDMITTGFIINIMAIAMITLLTLTIGAAVFGIDATVPPWVD